jgi:hypothetical protein
MRGEMQVQRKEPNGVEPRRLNFVIAIATALPEILLWLRSPKKTKENPSKQPHTIGKAAQGYSSHQMHVSSSTVPSTKWNRSSLAAFPPNQGRNMHFKKTTKKPKSKTPSKDSSQRFPWSESYTNGLKRRMWIWVVH